VLDPCCATHDVSTSADADGSISGNKTMPKFLVKSLLKLLFEVDGPCIKD